MMHQRRALKDRYLPALLITLLLFSSTAFAQYQKFYGYGYHYIRTMSDSALGIPKDTFALPAAYKSKPHLAANGDSLYQWSVRQQKFILVRADMLGFLTTAAAASTYVPYTGATGAVNLNTQALSAGASTFSGVQTLTGSGYSQIFSNGGITKYQGPAGAEKSSIGASISGNVVNSIIELYNNASGATIMASNTTGEVLLAGFTDNGAYQIQANGSTLINSAGVPFYVNSSNSNLFKVMFYSNMSTTDGYIGSSSGAGKAFVVGDLNAVERLIVSNTGDITLNENTGGTISWNFNRNGIRAGVFEHNSAFRYYNDAAGIYVFEADGGGNFIIGKNADIADRATADEYKVRNVHGSLEQGVISWRTAEGLVINTYAGSSNALTIYNPVTAVPVMYVPAGTSNAIFGADVSITAAKKLYLDGGGNTYFIESSADEVTLYTGGTARAVYDLNGLRVYAGGSEQLAASASGLKVPFLAGSGNRLGGISATGQFQAVTVSNGITATASTLKLGGTLTDHVEIFGAGYTFYIADAAAYNSFFGIDFGGSFPNFGGIVTHAGSGDNTEMTVDPTNFYTLARGSAAGVYTMLKTTKTTWEMELSTAAGTGFIFKADAASTLSEWKREISSGVFHGIAIGSDGNVGITGALKIATNTATDADYTVTAQDHFIKLPVISTASRTVTLPAASSHTGRKLIIKNLDGAGDAFVWSFASNVKKADGTTTTTINLLSVYELISDGTDWLITNIHQ